jgi:peptidoglycan/LPS O-acetylase OafA/YrhL
MNTETSPTTQLPRSNSNQLTYMVQLDGLRAIAVLGVLLAHFLPSLPLTKILDTGALGVQLFFVLSGFLITGILFKCKEDVSFKKSTPGFSIRQFYIRRVLRIFPIYYLTLFIALLFSVESVRDSLFWHLAYLSNVDLQMRAVWEGETLLFWTLSVEEQFYLVWPWSIIFIPKKHLQSFIVTTIITGILFKVVYPLLNPTASDFGMVLTLGHIDSLGLGALLALYTYEPNFCESKQRLLNLGFWVGLPLFVALPILRMAEVGNDFRFIFRNAIVSLFFVWLVARASKGFRGIIGSFLEFKPILYLGKISYGIYVYHLFVPLLISTIFSALDWSYPMTGTRFIKFFVNTGVTLIIAILSWHIIENPINQLKKHFEYTEKKQIKA